MRARRATDRTAGALPAPSLLQLMWLASPALPIGGFSYSEGLESAVECGHAATENAASDWLVDQLHLSLARCDLAVLAKAVGAWRRQDLDHVRELNQWVLHTRESSELRLQTEQMGRSLLEWLKSVHPDRLQAQALPWVAASEGEPSLTYPVAFALAASATQASVRDVLLTYAFGWAENLAQAAIKSVPLGQSAGQRILLRLSGDIPAVVEQALHTQDSERQAFTPMLAILSAQHETQYSRLFRS